MSAQDNLALGPSVHPWVSDGAQRIRFGISAVAQSWPEMHDLAQMAEGLGFDYVKHGRSELGRGGLHAR